MKDKIISYGSCVSIFQSNLQRSFGTISPLGVITGPASTMLYSWTGSVTLTSNLSIAFGTIERWRYEPNDTKPFNRDQWVLWSTGTPSLIKIEDAPKNKIQEHWSNGLPKDIDRVAPPWIKAIVQEKQVV